MGRRPTRSEGRARVEALSRASRALSLVQMGELSFAALEGAPLAPGNLATLAILTPIEETTYPQEGIE